jgi:hypothetical protein
VPTVSLRAFLPPLRLEVQPLARLHADGRLVLEGPDFPPEGPLLLVLWRPGERPAFALHPATHRRGRVEPGAEAWVVLWVPAGALGTRPRVHEAGGAEAPS